MTRTLKNHALFMAAMLFCGGRLLAAGMLEDGFDQWDSGRWQIEGRGESGVSNGGLQVAGCEAVAGAANRALGLEYSVSLKSAGKVDVTLTPLQGKAVVSGIVLEPAAPAASNTAAPISQVKYIPQRKDDIAWENDRIAHRIYGPALEPTGSGIDVWVKSVRYPIIDKWYKGGHYHVDSGEGLDYYSVGQSRGCGGIGIWDGKTLSVSGHWKSHEIKETGGERAVFVVNYAPWKLPDGHPVSEKRTFTVTKGSNLTLCESTLSSDVSELIVGIGIAKRKGGELYQNKENGIMAFWQTENPENGTIGLGVIVPPQDIVGFAEDKQNNLVLVKVKPGVPFSYRTGACWSKGLDFHSFPEWKSYLQKETGVK